MQKVINVLAVASFVMSGALVAGVGTVYVQRDNIKDRAAEQIKDMIGRAVGGAVGDLPSLLGGGGGGGAPVPSSPVGPGIPMPF